MSPQFGVTLNMQRHDNGVILSGPVFSCLREWVGVHSPTVDFGTLGLWLLFFFFSPPPTHGNEKVVRIMTHRKYVSDQRQYHRVCYDSLTYLQAHRQHILSNKGRTPPIEPSANHVSVAFCPFIIRAIPNVD